MLSIPQRDFSLNFILDARDSWSNARAATFSTSHGVVKTPLFMPVATHAALRGIDMALAETAGYQVLLANTYHLLLRPGTEVFSRFGGIHRFMGWPRSVLTDSGGFQIFSLSRQLRMSEEGARFRSYVDGKEIMLTPEVSIAAQRAIGSDIMMVLDHCIDSTSDKTTAERALALTTRWAKRSFAAREDSQQALFGIVQGACYPELRLESARQITDIPFDGFALGGLAVGETKSQREDIVEYTAPLLPQDRPRYLMGVGTPIDLLEAVKRGVDMFDCIIPTSLAHQGVCFTSGGKIDLSRGVFRNSQDPLDKECFCATCARFSRAYLHHLLRAGEFIAGQHLSLHNLTFYYSLMARMRESILSGTFKEFYQREAPRLMAQDAEFPPVPPVQRRKKESMVRGDYEIVVHESGYGSIKQSSSGEVMHSVVDPCAEALALYIAQPRLREAVMSPEEPLTIWDVGLGAATNAMTCIFEIEAISSVKRELSILSFERDLDPLRLALQYPGLFKHLRHAAPSQILKSGVWKNSAKGISWTLFMGDFHDTMQRAELPDIIWYDPFSYKVDSTLWKVSAFERLLEQCRGKATRLFTYTASTAVRAAMLAAGWYVGAGIGTGPKKETTVAFTPRAASSVSRGELLGASWVERWERSGAQQPFGESDPSFRERVRNHPQFSGR